MPRSGCEPIGGPTFELLGLNGLWERFQLHIPSLPTMISQGFTPVYSNTELEDIEKEVARHGTYLPR